MCLQLIKTEGCPLQRNTASGTASASCSRSATASPGNRSTPKTEMGKRTKLQSFSWGNDSLFFESDLSEVTVSPSCGDLLKSSCPLKVTVKICQECPDLELNPYLHTIPSTRSMKSNKINDQANDFVSLWACKLLSIFSAVFAIVQSGVSQQQKLTAAFAQGCWMGCWGLLGLSATFSNNYEMDHSLIPIRSLRETQ